MELQEHRIFDPNALEPYVMDVTVDELYDLRANLSARHPFIESGDELEDIVRRIENGELVASFPDQSTREFLSPILDRDPGDESEAA